MIDEPRRVRVVERRGAAPVVERPDQVEVAAPRVEVPEVPSVVAHRTRVLRVGPAAFETVTIGGVESHFIDGRPASPEAFAAALAAARGAGAQTETQTETQTEGGA